MHKSSRFALPLITRPTEHSGVTFGAATSVLLTVSGEIFAVRRNKKGGGLFAGECRVPRFAGNADLRN